MFKHGKGGGEGSDVPHSAGAPCRSQVCFLPGGAEVACGCVTHVEAACHTDCTENAVGRNRRAPGRQRKTSTAESLQGERVSFRLKPLCDAYVPEGT